MIRRSALLMVLGLVQLYGTANGAEPAYLKGVPLIPRQVLFGNPDKAAARISPDGKQLSYLAPVDGVLNVWVGPTDDPAAAKPVTQDKKRGIRSYFWAYTGKHILYTQDADGDENWHVYCVDLASGQTTDLTPIKGVAAQIESVSHRFPTEILVGLNDRDEKLHDVYLVNITTGERDARREERARLHRLHDRRRLQNPLRQPLLARRRQRTSSARRQGWVERLPKDPDVRHAHDRSGRLRQGGRHGLHDG